MLYIQQLDETDCGAACLAMVASYYGLNESITYIREIAGTDKNGTNLTGMVSAAKKLGLNAYALKGDKNVLSSDLPFPFIAHIVYRTNDRSFLHYVVIKSIKHNKVEIWDPDDSKRKYKESLNNFYKKWTGYALFFKAEKQGSLQKKKSTFRKQIFSVIKNYRLLILLVCFISLILVLLGIISTLYTRYVIDNVILSQDKINLTVISVGILIIVAIHAGLGSIRNFLLIRLSLKIDMNLVYSYFAHVFYLPLKFFESRKAGEIVSRIQDIRKIKELLSETFISTIMDTFMIIIVGPILYITNKSLFKIVLITLPFSVLSVYLFSKLYKREYRKLMTCSAELDSGFIEGIKGISTIKALNSEKYLIDKLKEHENKIVNSGFKTFKLQNYQFFLSEMIKQISNIIIIWAGSLYILHDDFTVGALIGFLNLLGFFTDPLYRLINCQSKFQESIVASKRLNEILELETEKLCCQECKWSNPLYGKINIKNLQFRYGSRKYVFENLNIDINAGEKVALVGESGAGKTTLIKLLLKMYEPENGNIYIDDHDITTIDSTFLRSSIGYVPQDIYLFPGTIAENISIHKPNSSFKEIVEAAKAAGVDTFIDSLPGAYEMLIGENGINLSGGQKQRIALARALLGNPNILILDEPTSNLDTLSENLIKDTINTLHDKKRTILIIAHRLSTIIDSDQIIVLDKGSVVQKGTHEELKKQNGIYKRLLNGMVL